MWGVLISGAVFILAIVFSLAKVSSNSNKITESHREELLARKQNGDIQYKSQSKKQLKG